MAEIRKALQERPQGALPSNIIPNPQEEIKAITTWSGNVLAGPSVPLSPPSSFSKEVERDQETITDQVLPGSTTRVLPPVVQSSPVSRSSKLPPSPSTSYVILEQNPHQHLIPYPSRLNKEKHQDKSDIQIYKFLQILLSDKEKLLGLANTSLTKNCSAVLLKKLPEKLRDPGKFLIPCDFPELEKCMALADLGKFTFPADFIVVDYDVDPRVPLILVRPFLRTARALVDVYGEELILRDGDEKLIFHADSTSKYPHKHGNESINMINFIDITCEDYFNKVLKIQKSFHPFSGNTTSPSDSYPSLTSSKTSDSSLKEFADKLALLKPFTPRNEDDDFDPEVDLREIEYLLNRDPLTDSSPKTDIDITDPILERFTDEPALLLECDSTLHEEFLENDTLPSFPFGNEDKVFNLGILVHGSTHFVTNEVTQDKNLKKKTSSEELLNLENSNFLSLSSDRELLFHLELTVTETLLSFSSENEDKSDEDFSILLFMPQGQRNSRRVELETRTKTSASREVLQVQDELEVRRLICLVRRLACLAWTLARLPELTNDSSRIPRVTLRLEDRECDSLSPAYQSEERDLMSIIGI
ncbi:hypothetical protein Tco_1367457 [Tanacetum coccineum]